MVARRYGPQFLPTKEASLQQGQILCALLHLLMGPTTPQFPVRPNANPGK